MEINEEIEEKVKEYESEQEGKELLDYIREIISQKGEKWDKGIKDGNEDLTAMLLYEYAKGIEKITESRVAPKYVINKISSSLGILRFGDFKKGIDDEVTYGKVKDENEERPLSVTEEEYTKRIRVKSNFGAHAPTYVGSDGKSKQALILFDNEQQLDDGTRLSGTNLHDLADIRHTIFHELTHIMEKTKIPMSDLDAQEIVFTQGESGSSFINYLETPDERGLDYYLRSMSEIMKNSEVTFSGISTIEVNPNKSKNRIMRNQISEGATEFISLLIMDVNGFPTKDRDRYRTQQEIIRRIFQTRGMTETLTDYLTSSNKVISYMENLRVGDKDFLHYADEFVNLSNRLGQAVQDNISETPVFPYGQNFDEDGMPSLYAEEKNSKIEKESLRKAFDILWQYPVGNEKRLVGMFFRQVIRDYYNPNPAPEKRVSRVEIMDMLSFAENFGKDFNQLLSKDKKKYTETQDKAGITPDDEDDAR